MYRTFVDWLWHCALASASCEPTPRTGVAFQTVNCCLINCCLHAGDLPGRAGTKGSPEPVLKGLFQALRLAEQCERAYQQIWALRAPTVAVYEATRQGSVTCILVSPLSDENISKMALHGSIQLIACPWPSQKATKV